MAGLALRPATRARLWPRFVMLAAFALVFAALSLAEQLSGRAWFGATWKVLVVPGLASTRAGAWLAVLVQFIGMVVGVFSSRYLAGEPHQPRYIAALAGVLAAVQILLLADHWLVLIASWSLAGVLLQRLLCFYRDRPFALLAAHKKRVADVFADLFLIAAGVLAYSQVGSGSLSALFEHLALVPASLPLQASALCLVIAVILRTALLPVHGWLTQVMEAPTPVSGLLHAGVVNLGGFVLIRCAPLLDSAPAARWLAVLSGLTTAALAALVMLTRVSIKVRLAWSTVAQMGFMVLECGLGLYSLAMLHLIGHSLYKAEAFLTSSSEVERATRRMAREAVAPSLASMLTAPLLAAAIIVGMSQAVHTPWPLWWAGVLACAWAPLLWIPTHTSTSTPRPWARLAAGLAMVIALSGAALLAHVLPFGLVDAPNERGGVVALIGLVLLYGVVVTLQWHPERLSGWRRRSYAGFYLDEFFTRAALRLWPTRWSVVPNSSSNPRP